MFDSSLSQNIGGRPPIPPCPRALFSEHQYDLYLDLQMAFDATLGLHQPARSPDLSPIEHIWDHVGRQVGHPISLNELEARLQQIRNEISQDIIQNLYALIPDRIASCIRARGRVNRVLNPPFFCLFSEK
ncbi:transposable element Tcb1 transposase [Trichonephila clavipes]|nr:transposable element Tcb1 transposase [Trichonephila clavipes]